MPGGRDAGHHLNHPLFRPFMKRTLKTFFYMTSFLLFVCSYSIAGEFKVLKVYDGDTIKVEGYGTRIKVRLAGIDAPEIFGDKKGMGQPYGHEARTYLQKLIFNKMIDIKGYGRDKHNLILGRVFFADEDINLAMVKAGLAEVYRGPPPEDLDLEPFWQAEKEVRALKKGMWVQEDSYVSPEAWRSKMGRGKIACLMILYGICGHYNK